ncbi:unnamed protein product [Boreogadus saida]
MVVISTKLKPRQYTVADGVRSKHYKAVRGDLPDPDVLKVAEAYQDFTADIAPLITTMAITEDVPLVDSAFGPVQEASPANVTCHYLGYGKEDRDGYKGPEQQCGVAQSQEAEAHFLSI